MFLFCCGQQQSTEVYRVRNKKASGSQVATFNQIDDQTARSFLPHMQVLKIKQSDYNALVQQYKGSKELWEDIEFPPTVKSFGDIPEIKEHNWKRLSQIVTDPVLFDGRIEPQDIIQGALGDCYFLSAIAALAEKEARITQIFSEQPGSVNGIYRVTLRISGVIQEIIIDDYVPVNKLGEPIFCQPNKNQIWVPLLQKAWAKANGSYENIISGSPTEIFKAATYAPSQVYETSPNREDNDTLWRVINENAKKNRPCCCGTSDDEEIPWASLGLVPGHAYTLIDAAQLQDMKGNHIRVLKLRNPWGNTQWNGQACQYDKQFWSQIAHNQERTLFLKDWTVNNDGIFFMLFTDYCKYFNQTHICFMEDDGNYVFENYKPIKKKGAFWQCTVFEEDQYIFELHQENVRTKHQEDSALSRATLIISSKNQDKYEYIAGVMSHFQEDTTLKVKLRPGKYIIFSKFDPSMVTKNLPENASVSVYSFHYTILDTVDRLKCDKMLTQSFLAYAKDHKRKKYEDDTLWISYKMMFKQGGYALIAFGAESHSKHRWEVTFNQSDFFNNGFKLKKPFKGKGQSQGFQVLPGQAKIILTRIKNQNMKNLKFPPAISWKMVPNTYLIFGGLFYLTILVLIVGVIGLFIKFYQTHIQMSESIDRPLLLNESLKDSTDPSKPLNKTEGSVAESGSVALTQPEEISPYKKKIDKRYKVLQVCSIIWIIVAIVFIFALPPLIEMLIIEQAKDQVIMTPKNQGLWGHFPGDTNTIIVRNFTFFYFDNEADFIFKNQKPIFTEYSGYKIQELQDFLDIEYLDGGNLVKVRDWTRFVEWYESKDLDDKVSILNMGNLGYWSTLKQARPTLLLQQGLALLFTNLEDSLIPTLLGSGINQQFITSSSSLYSSLLSIAGISKDNTEFLWSDPAYGFSDKENVGFWASAAIACFENAQNNFIFSNDAIVLKNYFALTDGQIKVMIEKVYSYVVSLRKLLLQNHYCAQINMTQCTGRYLGVAQLADGWVTGNTPPVSTISPNDTICDDNVTCKGLYPEPYAYAKNVFRMTHSDSDFESTPITFPRQSVLNWFNYNHSIQEGLDYNTAQNCLLHIGNLDDLWEMGMKYEQTFDKKLLQPMRVRFGLESIAQTDVFWYWIRYVTNDFVLQRGGNANLGVSNIFTSGFYEQFSLLQDNLQRFLLSKILVKELSTIQCHSFFERALDERDNPDLINSLCHQYPDTQSYEFSLKMVDACEHKYGAQWNELKSAGISLVTMENLCDIQGTDNVGGRLHKYKISLDSQYGCNVTPNPYCSNFELALLQWHNSSVTLRPPTELPELEPVTSFSQWNKKIKAIEYEHFIQKYFSQQKKQFPRYNLSTLVGFFTFENWFSTNLLVKQLKEGTVNPFFYQYIRYVCIYITLNGFTTTRTVREFLFGYEDEFLATVKSSYPPFGGDPSAPSIINFNDLNFTKEEASQTIVFKTGKADYRDVYQNYEINGYRYLVNNYTWFNGNKTVWEWQTPWKENDYFYGTTAKIFAPNQFEANNLSLLIPQVQRYGSNFFYNETEKIQRYGIDLYLGYLNNRIGVVSPENEIYYQTLPNVFNVTSIYGLPLYITKNHFMNATEWLERVDIYNEDHSILYQSVSKWDETFITVEPYTGVSFQSQIYLQNNYLQKQDPLYQYPTDVMLPIFSISRGGNLTEDKFHELYDPLVTAFRAKSAIVYVGIALAVVFIGLLVFATLKRKKIGSVDETRNISQLGISLQEQHHLHAEHYPDVAEEMVKTSQ